MHHVAREARSGLRPVWRALSLPLFLSDSVCDTEAPVGSRVGRPPSCTLGRRADVRGEFTDDKSCKIAAVTARVCAGIESPLAYHGITWRVIYMVAKIGIFMCCLYFTSN